MSYICNHCNTSFISQYNLLNHQKTAKYCIEIQQRVNITSSTESISEVHSCVYCKKHFTTKTNLTVHLSSCKIKKEYDRLESYRIQLEEQRIKYERQLSDKDNEIKLLQQENRMLKEQLSEKKLELTDKNTECLHIIDKLSQTQSHQNVTINDNSTNYNIQFNKMVEDLIPYTEENICKQFGKIPTNAIRSDTDDMDENFMSQFSKHMSPLAFCTDASRGRLVTKDEDGKPVKRLAEHVILDFIIKCKKEINIMIRDIGYKLQQDLEEGKIDVQEHQDFSLQHAYLHDYLKLHKDSITPYLRRLSNVFTRACPQMQRA